MAAETTMTVAQGSFDLRLASGAAGLRAWDAADEYALHHVAGVQVSGRCLVVGDRAGAVAIALAAGGAEPHHNTEVVSLSDSLVAHKALCRNLTANALTDQAVQTVSSATQDLAGHFDLVVVKVPRSLALLEHHLRLVRDVVTTDTVVVGAGMTRHIHTSTIEVFQAILGPTTTTRARKKARLLLTQVDPAVDPGPSPFPTTYELDGRLPPQLAGRVVTSHAGVFAQGRLDRGTALLLQHLPPLSGHADVVDLGCGDGVVGLAVGVADADAQVTFVEESYLALESARMTWQTNLAERPARFLLSDGMAAIADESADLVVVNPPFHDDKAMGDAVAWDMFTGARRSLRPGGSILVVGNRHLAYHAKLARLFGGCQTVASTPQFVVLSAVRKSPVR
ncbi:MAG: methyltransferase [Euzebya sp.]